MSTRNQKYAPPASSRKRKRRPCTHENEEAGTLAELANSRMCLHCAAELIQAHAFLADGKGKSKGKGKNPYPSARHTFPYRTAERSLRASTRAEWKSWKARTLARRPGMPSEEGRRAEPRVGCENGTLVGPQTVETARTNMFLLS